MSEPIFVGGSGGSGTTVVAQLLARHPDIALVPGELRFHCDAGGLAEAAAGRVPLPWLADRLRGYWKEREFPDGRPRGLTRFCPEPLYDAAVARFLERFDAAPHRAAAELVETVAGGGEPPAAPYWVEMSPPNCAAAEELRRMFPTARFVHVLRSGLDVACSYRARWWGPDDIRECLLWWGDRTADTAAAMARIPPHAAVTVRFEDLARDPRRVLAGAGADLGLDLDRIDRRDVRRTVRRGRTNVGRWRNEIHDRSRPELFALYRRQCERLRRAGLDELPPDLPLVDSLWRELPLRARLRGRRRALAAGLAWRLRGRRRWQGGRRLRLRVRARLDRGRRAGTPAALGQTS